MAKYGYQSLALAFSALLLSAPAVAQQDYRCVASWKTAHHENACAESINGNLHAPNPVAMSANYGSTSGASRDNTLRKARVHPDSIAAGARDSRSGNAKSSPVPVHTRNRPSK